jgi:predicted transposase YdaD
VVYSCRIDNKSAYIYILVEQQTKPDRLLPFRFLQYNVALLAEHLAQNKKGEKRQHLPIILNLCIYTGEKTPYPYSLDIYDCFEDPILARAEMFKPLSLADLGQIEDDELAKNGTADLLEMLLKRSRAKTFLKWIARHPEEMKKLGYRPYKISAIVYILGVEKKYSADELLETIVNIIPERKEDIMTAAQQLRQQGMQVKSLEIAKNMLSELHLDMQTVAQATGLSEEELMKLQEELSK